MSNTRKIYMTNADKERLQKLIVKEKELHWNMGKEYLGGLEQELERAQIIAPQDVPPDVITMNSKVLLEDLETGEEMTYTLVYPEDADVLEDKISVLAPVGTAILGYKVGDILNWPVPDGVVRLRVKELLYQPEAAGDFEL